MSDQKSKFDTELEALPAEQFAQVHERVRAEAMRRDMGASEAELARKLGTMGMNEFQKWKAENGWA